MNFRNSADCEVEALHCTLISSAILPTVCVCECVCRLCVCVCVCVCVRERESTEISSTSATGSARHWPRPVWIVSVSAVHPEMTQPLLGEGRGGAHHVHAHSQFWIYLYSPYKNPTTFLNNVCFTTSSTRSSDHHNSGTPSLEPTSPDTLISIVSLTSGTLSPLSLPAGLSLRLRTSLGFIYFYINPCTFPYRCPCCHCSTDSVTCNCSPMLFLFRMQARGHCSTHSITHNCSPMLP